MGLVYLRELNTETKFALWRIEETAEELLGKLQLDEREKAKLESLTKGKRRLHWLATRVLLRFLLKTEEYINCPSDEHGKPYLPDYPYNISLTHSYDFAGVLMSTQGPCGIDLEIIKEKIVRIKEKFMKPRELAFIQNENIDQMYACWCAKEAVYKLQGNKGVSFLEDMTILPFQYRPQGVMTLLLRKDKKTHSFQVYYEQFQEYMLAYVVSD
ncbi:4'-phosphopantetheinyl transferase family protein [Sphingobacterium psychroaquaticum]|uniref:Phosphopantetheinyl transferase n=1 Tax=Sphingobacterium psychroaquaticum TaxID=561061 RepID=A0A1X7L1F3_9SPHI|nr:4'-phosphopantetheinyl transferase superfamily protein [Sphingobacterium psychroaquaticum]QBQ39807.1 4'-phosphopantetheinyl transferase superfamily protein [Sphingobacterium psychroaquaticum]SMG47447.1 Phosphopantetheinyl transferase [Sphingobacterium psychroaquaticum]